MGWILVELTVGLVPVAGGDRTLGSVEHGLRALVHLLFLLLLVHAHERRDKGDGRGRAVEVQGRVSGRRRRRLL